MSAPPARHPLSLFEHLRPHRGALILGAALLIATNVLEKAIPFFLGDAIDALVAHDYDYVIVLAGAVIAAALVAMVVRTLSRIFIFNVGRDIEFELRQQLLARLHVLGPSFFQRMPTGDIMSRAINDLGQVRLLVGFGLMNVINAVFAYSLGLALLLYISPELTLYALVPYPLFVFVAGRFAKALFARSREAQDALGQLSQFAQEHLAGVRVIRAFALEARERERFATVNERALDKNMKLVVLRGFMFPILASLASVGTLIVLGVGGRMVLRGELTVGEFTKFNAALGQLVWPTLALGYVVSIVQRGRASYARLREILDADVDIEEAPDAKPAKQVGALAVRDLRFRRGERAVLDGVTFEVPARSSLAVVGKTGSGKSTLAALLPRLLPTPADSVWLDGDDVTQLRLRDVRKSIGYAQQEPFLFSTTVARNIGLALDDAEGPDAVARIRRAATDAAIVAEIDALPDGFDTVVGERGVQLSGGQKQRIALARALLNEPTVLVLDDPLSAVDARTEATILQALDRAGEGRTLVLVTNRVAAASRAQRIVVLDEGNVVESGTHDELLVHGGIYASIARRQSLEREVESFA